MDKKFVTNFIWKLSERLGAQLISFIVVIILSRLLEPEEYGTIALVTVFFNICDVIVKSGFGQALVQKKKADSIDFSTVFYFSLSMAIFLYMILFCTAPLIAHYYTEPVLKSVIRVMGIRIIIDSINSVQYAYVTRKMIFKKFFFATLLGTFGSAVIGIIMAYHEYGIWALVFQNITSSLINTVMLWILLKWRPVKVFSLRHLKAMYQFSWKLFLTEILETVYTQFTNLVIGKVYGTEELAYYNKGQQIPYLVMININTSLNSVLFPAISRQQDDLKRIKYMIKQTLRVSTYILFPVMIGIMVISRPLIIIVFSEKWAGCVIFLQLACAFYIFRPIHTANTCAIQAIGRSDLVLKLEILKKALGLILLIIAIPIGVKMMAFSMVICAFISTFINIFPNKKLLSYGYYEQFHDIGPTIFISIVMGILVNYVGIYIKNNYLCLLVQIILGVLIYIGLSVLCRLSVYKELLYNIKNVWKNRGGK